MSNPNRITEYDRVLPRDLFNEAKLLKCMGRLILLIHDNATPVKMSFWHDGNAFDVALLLDGSLMITNLEVKIRKKVYRFKTIYNSKANYPLYLEHDSVDWLVFDETGEFSKDFYAFLETIKKKKALTD